MKRAGPTGDGPVHVSIAHQLRAELGEYEPGDLLPGDRELAERFGVSRMTVRQAVAALVADGLVDRVRGSGTFVAERPVHRRMGRLLSFTEHMRRHGKEPSAQVLARDRRPGSRTENADLHQPADADVGVLRRVLLGDDVPMALEDVILPARVTAVLDEDLTGSLQAALTRHGHGPRRSRGTLTAEPADPRQAKLLDVAIGAALVVQRLVLTDAGGLPVQLVTVRHVGERLVFDIDQERPDDVGPADDVQLGPPYEVRSLNAHR